MTNTRPRLADADRSAVRDEMRSLMVEVARARDTITYSEVTMRLQTARVHYHSAQMALLLDEIGREEMAAGRPPLPAVVVRKSTRIPGAGYFRETAHLDHSPADLEASWRRDVEQVWAYWAEDAGR